MPSTIELLQKFLNLETQRGFDDRAVVGGLIKILPLWQGNSSSEDIDADIIHAVTTFLGNYHQLSPEERKNSLDDLSEVIKKVPRSRPIQPPSTPSSKAAERPTTTHLPEQPVNPSQPSVQKVVKVEPRQDNTAGTIGLKAPLTVISGIGPAHAQTLKSLDLTDLEDLLYYFPRRYDDYSQLKPINKLQYGEELTIIATVQNVQNRTAKSGSVLITEAVVSDDTGFLRLTWFNQPYIANKLLPGIPIVISGKVDMYLGRLMMSNPDWELIEQEHLHTNRIVPVYPLTAKVTQKWLRRIMFKTVSFWASRIPDYLPDRIKKTDQLLNLSEAISQIHFPDTQESLRAARSRLAFDEIFLLQLGLLRQKYNWESQKARSFSVPDEWINQVISLLPYQLTNAQQQVLQELRSDLASGRPMNRLLQGDVGSGKTVIAALVIAMINSQGCQAAFMAPTSILADQHYQNLHRLLCNEKSTAPYNPGEIRLLIGETPEAEKSEIRTGLLDGSIKVIIGTHALIEEPVQFKNLQFIVVDEQHRFGVAQRALLREKGENPHLLVMTATPIPRSLALTVYGDLDLSLMDEMPVGRLPIETHLLHPVERERAYQLIRLQIEKGAQAFIIYPMIEQGEREVTKAAVDEHHRLQSEVFPNFKLGLLHGRMKQGDKDKVMDHFRKGEYQVLVSTTVIEVGVDVPNATVMLIEGANRFGLAQLHQLRGRVGRGQVKSYCILIPETEDSIENERLTAMVETNDGFVLAERDLQQRGPGEFLGTRQAGFSELKIANITDIHLIEKARNRAKQVFESDPALSLPENQALEQKMQEFWSGGKGDVS